MAAVCSRPPVLLVNLDDRLAEFVDFVDPAQPDQAIDSCCQVRADLHRVIAGIQGQLAQAVVGILEVAVLVVLGKDFSLFFEGWHSAVNFHATAVDNARVRQTTPSFHLRNMVSTSRSRFVFHSTIISTPNRRDGGPKGL